MRLLKILGPLAISLLSACGGDSGQNSGGQGGAGATSSTGGTAGSGGSAGSAGAGGSAGAAVGVCPTGHPLGAVARKPTVQVKFGDKGPFEFVYDTGAPTSVMDTATFKQIGQGPYEIHVADKTIPLGYMTTTSIAQYGIPGIDGILGADVMGGHSVTLDVKRGVFWMEAARDESDLLACDHVEKNPVDVPYVYQHYFFVPGKAEGLEGWFLVDSGASLGAMPSGVFDTLQAKAPRPAIGGFYTPAGIGTFWAQLTTIGSLEVAGRAIKNITTRTIPEGMIPLPQLEGGPFLGVLPNGYLSHFLVTIDSARRGHPHGWLRRYEHDRTAGVLPLRRCSGGNDLRACEGRCGHGR